MFKLTLRTQKVQRNNNGFTIIEVALVLAIAAMIFLVVFLAVPALQRNQRDDAKKRDVSNVVAAIETYFANSSNGSIISESTAYSKGPIKTNPIGQYLDTLSKNIDNVELFYETGTTKPHVWGDHIDVYFGKQCDGMDQLKNASPRSAAVTSQLESGSTNYQPKSSGDGQKHYCLDAS